MQENMPGNELAITGSDRRPDIIEIRKRSEQEN